MTNSYQKGLLGETLAAEYLEKKGYALVQTRFLTRYGEIDLIMKKGEQIIFVEVKYRPGQTKGQGVIAVNSQKQRKMLLAINEYVMINGLENTALRIDVVEITKTGVWHIENAF